MPCYIWAASDRQRTPLERLLSRSTEGAGGQMNRAYLIGLTAAAGLIGHMSAASQPNVSQKAPAESPDAQGAFVACLAGAAARVDDHQSDASTIAAAILPSCSAEGARAAEAYSEDMNPAARAIFMEKVANGALMPLAVNAVLQERRSAHPN